MAWQQQAQAGQQAWGQQAQPQPAAAWGGQQQQAAAAAGWGQQQQAAAPQQQLTKDCTLVVTGCTHATVGGIVRGNFQLTGENHGKPTYQKDGQVNGLDVMTYYWDERDGAGFCGWWFGPKVGGDQVWAYHPDKAAAMPPQTGWKVPYDGPVDVTFVIQYKPKQAAQPQQQAWGQQAQQPQVQQQQQQQVQQQQQQLQQMQLQQQQAYAQQQQQAQQTQQQQVYQQQQVQQNSAQQLQMAQQQQQLAALKQQQQQQQKLQADQLRQQQMMQQQQKLTENKARLEQANATRMQEQKAKMAVMKQQQQELIARRAEEQQKKEAEMVAKRLEQAAVLSIRRVMQVFRASQPDKFDENKAKLDEVCAQELEKCGSVKAQMTAELEKAMEETKLRLVQLAEAKKAMEEKTEAENKRRRELKEKAEELIAELEKLVVKAEEAAKGVTEEAEPVLSDKEMKILEVEACVGAVEEAAKDANQVAQVCADFVLKESVQIKNTLPIMGEAPATCGADLQKLQMRMSEAKKTIGSTLAKVTHSKISRINKAAAKEKYEKGMVAFTKYDTDKDGKLSRKEIQAYSKGFFKFTVPVETLDFISESLVDEGSKGVEKTDFHRLNIMIGVAREAAIDAKRKAVREEREKELEAAKEKLKAKMAKISEDISEATTATSETEKKVLSLNLAENKAKSSVEMVALADEADTLLEKAREKHAAVKEVVAGMAKAEIETELKGFLALEIKRVEGLLKPLDSRNIKSTMSLTAFRNQASKKNSAELEKLRTQALAMIFHHQGAKDLMSDGVFEEFDKRKAGKVTESSFVSFFKTCEKKEEEDDKAGASMPEEDVQRLFSYLDSDEEGFLSKDQFLSFIRRFMKVVKASVLTEEISIKSGSKRRLEEGEILDVLSGPTKEIVDDAEIIRLKVRAMSDDVEGWVTPVGNQDTVYLKDGGDKFKVVKETILTGSFVIGEDTKTKDKKLKVGEICEVREWARKEETSELMRMKVRVQSDGTIGFVTQLGNTGIPFLEVM